MRENAEIREQLLFKTGEIRILNFSNTSSRVYVEPI